MSNSYHGLIAYLVLTSAIEPGVGAAQSPAEGATLRVVVRVCNARDARALSRLRGQTSDLRVTLVVREGDELEPQFGQQLDRASSLGVELDASAVVWFDGVPGAAQGEAPLLVYVATPGSGRVLARQLGADAGDGGGAPPESALLEQSALVVRFALEGLAMGGAIGVERGAALAEQPLPVAPPEPAPRPEPPPQLEPALPPPSPSEPARDGPRLVWLGFGYQAAADGLVPVGHHGLVARVEFSTSRLDVALASSVSLPTTHHEARADLRLQRVGVAASAAAVWPLSARWTLTGGGQGGVVVQGRETIEPAPEVTARPARWMASLAFGPELRARYRVDSFGVALAAALDVLPAAPRFVYRQAEREIEGSRAWSVQPRLVLTAEVAP